MKRKTIILIILISLIVIVYSMIYLLFSDEKNEIIGGQRDDYGCLIGAGYSYSSDVGVCTRQWEINTEGKKRAAKLSVDSIGWSYALTVINVLQGQCVGCFGVELEIGEERTKKLILIDEWSIVFKQLNAQECENIGGRVSSIFTSGCSKGEKNAGNLERFDFGSICCVLLD